MSKYGNNAAAFWNSKISYLQRHPTRLVFWRIASDNISFKLDDLF